MAEYIQDQRVGNHESPTFGGIESLTHAIQKAYFLSKFLSMMYIITQTSDEKILVIEYVKLKTISLCQKYIFERNNDDN